MISAFHGVGAYRGQRNPIALRNALDTALSGVELCVADRPIGAFGALLFGYHTATFAGDVWSYVMQDGTRNTDNHYPVLSGDVEQHAYEEACRHALNERGSERHYCESWVSASVVRALWVKPWAPAATKKAAAILAKNRGVPLLEISGATRVWDVLDNVRLPFSFSVCGAKAA